MRLAFADALDLRSVEAIDLAPSLVTVLVEHAGGQLQRPEEDRLKVLLPGDPTGDIADGAPKIGLELEQRLADALELMGMGIALKPNQGCLAHSRIGLAQIKSDLPCQ